MILKVHLETSDGPNVLFRAEVMWLSAPRSEAKASGWLQSAFTTTDVISQAPSLPCTSYYSSSSVVSCAFSAHCMYLKFGHHPHFLGYLCAKFRFCSDLHCWASPWRKSRTQSLTQLIRCTKVECISRASNILIAQRKRGYDTRQWRKIIAT